MAEIDTSIWGAEEDWKDIVNNYSSGVPVEERIQYASLDPSSASTFENYLLAGKVRANNPIDQSLCYGALGDKMPLSNISNTAGVVGWRPQENGYTPYRSYVANLQTSGNKDTRTATNYVLGTWTTSQHINIEQGIQLYIRSAQRNDRFHELWLPDSLMNKVGDWSSSDKTANPTVKTSLLARIPVKNMIAIPRVKCLSTVSTTGATASYVDLLDYINPQSSKNYTTHPYVVSVGLVFVTAQDGVSETINRNLTVRLNTCVITSPSNMMKNMPYYEYGGWDRDARYTGDTYNYASCIGIYNRNDNACMMPIMGLINAPDRTDVKFQDVNVISDRDGNWDLFDVRFDLGTDELATKGGGYALRMYSWAGKDPNIYTVEDDNPNHTDGQRYQNSTQYWAWEINANNVEEFREDVRKATAGFGLFFVEGTAHKNVPLDDEDMFLGILEDGIGNGLYSHGEDNRLQDQWNWDDMHENDYDPDAPTPGPDPEYDFESELEANNRPLGVPGANIYISTLAQFQEVKDNAEDRYAEIIAEAEDGDFSEVASLAAAFGHTENPSDCYYNIICYPFKISDWISNLTDTSSARLGKSDFTASTQFKWVGSAVRYGVIPCGQVLMRPDDTIGGQDNWKCFLNYPPYTTASLYLPFCGTIEIDPCVYMNRYIGVKYLVDWRSGACQALVFRSSNLNSYGELMESISGTMGYRTNFSATDATAYCNSMVSLASRADDARRSLLETAAKGIKAALSSNNTASAITNTATGLYNIAEAKDNYDIARYELQAEPVPVKKISTATPAINTLGELSPRLDIYRSVSDYTSTGDNARYGSVIGNRCLIIGQRPTINAYGYVVYDKIELWSTTATEKEIGMIKSLLSSGVYVDQYVPTD